MHKILLVEDSKEIYQMVSQAVGSLVDLSWASTVTEATQSLSENNFSLILLDVELPDGNGIDLCSKIQASNPNLPIFFLTAHADLSEKVLGFSAGADDYITKPFAPLELRARLESRLRKLDLTKQNSDRLKWKELEINKSRQEVSINENGQYHKIDLTALEFKILLYFAAKPGDVILRDQILNDIWGEDIHVYHRSVDTHVSKLRKKLGTVSNVIESVHGAGYKFCPSPA